MRRYFQSDFAKTLNQFLIKLLSLPHSLYKIKKKKKASRFFTTEPPGKPKVTQRSMLNMWKYNQRNQDLKFLWTCHLVSSFKGKCERKIGTEKEHLSKDN